MAAVLVKPWTGRSVDIPNITGLVHRHVQRPSSCVPSGAVLLTYVNPKHAGLRALQLQRVAALPCLVSRLVSVCYGVPHDGLGGCESARDFGPADLNQALAAYRRRARATSAGSYFELIWAKWRLLLLALLAASEVFWVDADVVLFQSPWPAPPASLPPADILYQSEFACPAASCLATPAPTSPLGAGACALNGGVMLVRSVALVRRVVSLEPDFGVAPGRAGATPVYDQDVADSVARGGDFSFCPLPSASFVGFCWWAWGYNRGNRSLVDRLYPCRLASFHAHCISSPDAKRDAMQRMLDKTAHCATSGDTGPLGVWGPRARPAAGGPRSAKPKGKAKGKPHERLGLQLQAAKVRTARSRD